MPRHVRGAHAPREAHRGAQRAQPRRGVRPRPAGARDDLAAACRRPARRARSGRTTTSSTTSADRRPGGSREDATQPPRSPPASARVAHGELDVDLQRPRRPWPRAGAIEQERRDRLAAHSLRRRRAPAPSARTRSCSSGSSCAAGGSGLATTTRAARADRAGRRRRRRLLGLSTRQCSVEPRVGDVEAGEGRRPVADDGHASVSSRSRVAPDVEDRLHARADHDDRRPGQRGEVGGLVEGLARAAVHAAEPAGGEDADPGRRGEQRGAATVVAPRRRGPRPPAGRGR